MPLNAVNALAVAVGAFVFGLLFMLAVGFPLWNSAPFNPLAVQAILAGPNLARWTCSAEEQQRFRRQELGRLGGMVGRRLLIAVAIAIGVPIALLIVTKWQGSVLDSVSVLTAVGVGAVLAGMYAGAAAQVNPYFNQHRLRARYGRAEQPADGVVAVNRTGAYFFGDYFVLNGVQVSARHVALQPGEPAALLFEIEIRGNRNSVTKQRIYVPVAASAQAEAAALIRNFPDVN